MTGSNGQQPEAKPPPDPQLLTPNDYRRLRAKLEGRNPEDVFRDGVTEDVLQMMILAWQLRADPAATWDQAGDVAPAVYFDMTGGRDDEEPDPQTAVPGSRGPGAATTPAGPSKPAPPKRAGVPS